MAIKNKQTNQWEPGWIYALEVQIGQDWHRFYVGETTDQDRRFREHDLAGRNADDTSTCVYQTLHDIKDQGLSWRMVPLEEYGTEGPTDLEDEWIMKSLLAGDILANEKKGNANWMQERLAVAEDMRKRSITSYREYQRVTLAERLAQQGETEQPPQMALIMGRVKMGVMALSAVREEQEQQRKQRAARQAERVAAARQQQQQEWLAANQHLFGDQED